MKADVTHIFESIYTSQSDAIFRFCLMRVSDREQALDITEETFVRFWQSLQQGKEILNARAFLFTVARRLIIDWYRKKKSISLERMMSNNDEEGTASDVIDETTFDNRELGPEGRYLLGAIGELSSDSRDLIHLRFVEDLTPKEIGGILGISANAASVRINRALRELRKKTGYDGGMNA
jgi:RNA polymerase sigma-70 factor (ECF subfamily)